MATIIRIKRSTGHAAPTSLKSGELAYSAGVGNDSNGGDRLYFGKGDDGSGNATTVERIGGAYFMNMLDHIPGRLEPNSALITDSKSKLRELKVDHLVMDSSVVKIVDPDVTNRNLTLRAQGSGSIDVKLHKIINVGNPADSNDAANKDYVDTVAAGGTITLQTDSSGVYAMNLQDSTLQIRGGDGGIVVDRLEDTKRSRIKIHLGETGVDSGDYGSATLIPKIRINKFGTIDSAGTVPVASTLNLASDSSTTGSVDLLDSSLYIHGGYNIHARAENNRITVSMDSHVLGLSSLTVDNLKLDGNTLSTTDSSGDLYINPWPSGDSGRVVIFGNLQVDGTTTTINSVNLTVNDKIITLADSSADSAAAHGAGIEIAGANASLKYHATNDRFEFNKPVHTPYHFNGKLTSDSATITKAFIDELEADSASILGDIRITGNIIGANTDNLQEGDSNLYYTTARHDSDFNVAFLLKTTDSLAEGDSNLYFTNERVDDRIVNLLLTDSALNATYDDSANTLKLGAEKATITTIGVAHFGGYADSENAPAPGNARQFSVSALGNVSIAIIDGGTY